MKAWEITRKDLKLLLRDKRTLVILVLFPLIFITILGITTGQLNVWGNERQDLKIAIVDEVDYDAITDEIDRRANVDADASKRNAKLLIAQTVELLQERNGLLVQFMDGEPARKLVNDGEAHAAIIFGPRFFQRVSQLRTEDVSDTTKGRLAEGLESLDMQVHSRTPGSGRTSVIEDVVYIHAIRVIAPFVLCKNNLFANRIEESCEVFVAQAAKDEYLTVKPGPVQKKTSAEGAGGNEVYQELVPSYTVMFVFFLVNLMARSFIHERDQGTLRRLKIAPITGTSLLSGKTTPFFIISLVQTAILFIAGKAIFQMNWGTQPALLLPVAALTSLAATALGLLVATWVRTDSQVSAYSNLVVITAAGISGCFMPRDWLPPILQKVSYATPHAWALIAYDQILQNPTPNLTIVWQCCGMLAAFALVFFLAGCVRFARTAS